MPSDYTPTPTARTPGDDVSTLVNGDAVNRDNLYVEAAPSATPKLTLGLLVDWIDGILTAGVSGVALLAATLNTFTGKMKIGSGASDPGTNGLGVAGDLIVAGATTLANFSGIIGTVTNLRISQSIEKTQSTPSASAATLTWTVTDGSVVFLDQHTVPLALTLADPASSGSRRYEVDIFWNPQNGTDDLTVKNAGASTIGGLGDAGWIRYRWDGTAWRGFGGVNFAGGTFLQSA